MSLEKVKTPSKLRSFSICGSIEKEKGILSKLEPLPEKSLERLDDRAYAIWQSNSQRYVKGIKNCALRNFSKSW